MNSQSEQIKELVSRVNKLKFEDYRELDAIRRKASLIMRRVFGKSSTYLDDLQKIKFPKTDPFQDDIYYKTIWRRDWQLSTEQLSNLFSIMLEDLETSESEEKVKRIQKRQMSNRIFVVHGQDEEMKQSVARTLEKLDLKPLILHEQPNEGRTIIEKIEDYSDVSFAVVLLTPDDLAYPQNKSPEKAKFRARQNVIFELGFFVGKIGRKNVIVIYRETEKFEMPSDYSGVLYTPYDKNGRWIY